MSMQINESKNTYDLKIHISATLVYNILRIQSTKMSMQINESQDTYDLQIQISATLAYMYLSNQQ